MEPHLKRGQSSGSCDGITSCCRSHHQTCCGQDAVSVCLLDGFVYRDCETEVVSRDNELPHAESSSSTSRPVLVSMNFVSRQIVVRLVKASTHEPSAAISRNGTSQRARIPSRSFKPQRMTIPETISRTASVPARTLSPIHDPKVERANKTANGTGRMIMVENRAPGLAARLF